MVNPFESWQGSESKGSSRCRSPSLHHLGTGMYHVYILRCCNLSPYVGYTKNVEARVRAHTMGLGAAHTYKHGPVELVYSEAHPTRLAAIRRERQIKRWTRRKKEARIRGDLVSLRAISKRRT